jgi:hypothetical protein
MAIDNLHTLKGVLNEKLCRRVPNTKKPTEPDWEFYSIKVETKTLVGGRTIVQIPELSLDRSVSYEGFEIGDSILVDFYLTGKAINEKFFKTECKAIHIGFAPLENGEMRTPRKNVDTVFIPPNPAKEEDNDDGSDLPF